MTAAREYWAEQVREHRDEQGRAFRYVHVRHPGAQGLIVHFSAFFGEWGEARQHRRVFSGHFHRLRMLGDVADYDWLFVCDEYGADGNGTYYTGESGDMFIERAMLDLIRSVAADFEVITPGGFTVIDVEDHVGPGRPIPSDGVDVLGIFHMTPTRFLGQDAIDIELSAIFDQVSVSDEYIEYHSREWSVAAGLAYQSIPMNDPRFGGTRSTLMQSPKLLVDEQTDTHLVLLNISTSPDYNLDISFDLGTVTRRLAPFNSLLLRMSDVLQELGAQASFGTVAVDVAPSPAYWRRLVEVGPQNAMAQSPFWMGYVDDGGSVAYVHSIDQFYGAVFGVGRVAALAYRGRWHRGGQWTSKRLIDARGLVRADAYLVNHSPASGRTTVRWVAHPEGMVIAERTLTVQPHGAVRVSVTAADLSSAGAAAERLRLEVDGLLTGNGKPYVMVRYNGGPFSLHHG